MLSVLLLQPFASFYREDIAKLRECNSPRFPSTPGPLSLCIHLQVDMGAYKLSALVFEHLDNLGQYIFWMCCVFRLWFWAQFHSHCSWVQRAFCKMHHTVSKIEHLSTADHTKSLCRPHISLYNFDCNCESFRETKFPLFTCYLYWFINQCNFHPLPCQRILNMWLSLDRSFESKIL